MTASLSYRILSLGRAASLFGGLLLAGWPALAQGPEVTKQCAMLPAAKVRAVFGAFDDVMASGGYIPGGEVPNVAKVHEMSISTCVFRRQSTREVLQIIADWYPSFDDAAEGFEHASRAQSHGVPYYTKGVKKGPIQVFEGKGRSLAYLSNSVVMAHWLAVNGTSVQPTEVPGERLTPLLVEILCPAFPACKVPALKP
jgi:hypothetical protein